MPLRFKNDIIVTRLLEVILESIQLENQSFSSIVGGIDVEMVSGSVGGIEGNEGIGSLNLISLIRLF